MNRALKIVCMALLLPVALSVSLTACHTMGPNEVRGEKIDKALGTNDDGKKDGPFENTGQSIDKATGQDK